METTPGAAEGEGYGWGPANHPLTLAWSHPNEQDAPSGTESLHWDGGDLLFTSSANGLGSIFLGKDAFYQVYGGSFQATPRDASGIDTYDCGGFTYTPFSPCSGSPSPFATAPSFGDFTLDMPRGDGVNTGLDTIQGVRSYNSDTLTWTTPDAYAGEPTDPMSLQKYMWNRNNPLAYSDPSGYDAIYAIARPADVSGYKGFAHLFIEVSYRQRNGKVKVTRYSLAARIDTFPLLIGRPLVQKDQQYDQKFSGGGGGAFGKTKLASCRGTCTVRNGGGYTIWIL